MALSAVLGIGGPRSPTVHTRGAELVVAIDKSPFVEASLPIEVLSYGSPLKNIYSLGFINKAPQESYMLPVNQLNISSYPKVIFSEITAQISKNHNSTIILLIAVIMILWSYNAFMDIAFIGAITMGAVMSQAHGQGFGTNLLWLNYALIVGVFLAAKAWGKPRAHEHELILGA